MENTTVGDAALPVIVTALIAMLLLPLMVGIVAHRRTGFSRFWIIPVLLLSVGILTPALDVLAAPGCGFLPWVLASVGSIVYALRGIRRYGSEIREDTEKQALPVIYQFLIFAILGISLFTVFAFMVGGALLQNSPTVTPGATLEGRFSGTEAPPLAIPGVGRRSVLVERKDGLLITVLYDRRNDFGGGEIPIDGSRPGRCIRVQVSATKPLHATSIEMD